MVDVIRYDRKIALNRICIHENKLSDKKIIGKTINFKIEINRASSIINVWICQNLW